MEIEPRWKKGVELKETIKIILFQIFSDDNMSLDYRSFYLKLNKSKKLFLEILSNPEIASKHIPMERTKEIFEIKSRQNVEGEESVISQVEIDLDIISYAFNKEDPLKYFLDKILLSSDLQKYKIVSHNKFYLELNKMIQSFFAKRKEPLLKFAKDHLPGISEFQEIVGGGLVDQEILYYEQQIDSIARIHMICLRKCSNCSNFCILLNAHKEKECNCGTDHICIEHCRFCEEVRCSLSCGHERNHICSRPDHTCPNQCTIPNCTRKCAYGPEHSEECKCSGSHPCNENCDMFYLCGETCRKQITEDHTDA